MKYLLAWPVGLVGDEGPQLARGLSSAPSEGADGPLLAVDPLLDARPRHDDAALVVLAHVSALECGAELVAQHLEDAGAQHGQTVLTALARARHDDEALLRAVQV